MKSFVFLFRDPDSFKVFELAESERSSAMFDSPSCPSFGRNGAELKINITSGVVDLTPGITYQGFQELYDIFGNKSESHFISSDIEVLQIAGKA